MHIKILSLFILLSLGVLAQKKSIEELENSLHIADTDSARGSICHKLSVRHYRIDNNKSKAYATQSLQYFEQSNKPKGQGLALQMLAFIQLNNGQSTESYQNAMKSIDILTKNGFYKQTLPSYSAASYYLEKEGRYDEALKRTIQCLKMIDEKGINQLSKAKNQVDLARIYRQTNQLDKAIKVYEEALEIAQKEEDNSTTGTIWMNIGNVYIQKGDPKKALASFEAGLSVLRACECISRLNLLWRNIGFAHLALGDTASLRGALDSSIRTFTDTTDLEAYSDIEILRGGLLQIHGEHTKAIV